MRCLTMVLVLALSAAPSSAQTLEAASPDAAWTLVKDLPPATRLTLVTAEQEFDATLAAVRGDELVVTEATVRQTQMRQATGVANGFIVPRASLTGTRVKKMGNQYRAAPEETPNPVTARHVLDALGRRKVLEIRATAPKPIVGRIDSISDTSVTIVFRNKSTDVPLQDVQAVRAYPRFSRGDAIMAAVIVGVTVTISSILSQFAK